MKQRGISHSVIEYVVLNGEEYRAPGGAIKKMVPTGEIDTQIKYHQEQKEICEAARQISIVEKDGQMLTVMHQNTRILRK